MPIRGFTSKVKVHDELIPVNPDTIFRRIPLLQNSDGELQIYFEFELAPFPLSLFDVGGLCKTHKSVVYDLFSTTTVVHFTSACYVVDGGFLLHRVLWQGKGIIFFHPISAKSTKICERTKILDAAKSTKICERTKILDAAKSTKSVECIRRTKKHIAGYDMFDESM
ncbi:hypothetical protein AVEN_18609-1 [Araneus ventricosus]|uniref:Uncharacterized protein n=1 Tax=Araneus ventricosus TaxID=182803 RepID=A0A4Y2FQH5_ARAVE|nr:hypothetical protein AVEN_18609-1 [Araneus ventricosus]